MPEHAARVLDGLLGLDRAVGDDLGDPLLAVLLGDVADHLAAPALVEVDVEVGQRGTFRVEEALEDEAVRHGVEVGDAHRVGAHRAGARPATGADADAVALGPVDEVGDDEEVAGVALRDDDVLLEGRLLARVVGHPLGEAALEAGLDLLDEPRRLVLARGAGEARHVAPLALLERDLAALGDEQRVVAGLGQLAPEVAHLGGGLEVEVVGVELEAVGVHQGRARLHAEQGGVRLGVLGLGVVQVVGRDEREPQVAGQTDQVALGAALDLEAVVHQLDVDVVGTEDVAQLARHLARLVVEPEPQLGLDLARRAAGRDDEALAVGGEQLAVDARPLRVDLIERGDRAHPEEVVHADVVLGQHRHVGVGAATGDVVAPAVAPADLGAVGAVRAGRDVGLDADDRLDPRALRLLPELVGAEDVAVVGRREGRHAHPGRLGEEVADAGRPVEHGVLRVHVEVHEVLVSFAGRLGSTSWRV